MNKREIVDFVRIFDREAADYLKENGRDSMTSISEAFLWMATPQGDSYWRNIRHIVDEYLETGKIPENISIVPEDLFEL